MNANALNGEIDVWVDGVLAESSPGSGYTYRGNLGTPNVNGQGITPSIGLMRWMTSCSNAGKPYRTRYHRVWDKKVREISGGLTIMSPVKGQWVNPDGDLFSERMIPVRIIATEEQIEKIIAMTIKYYDQIAILAIRVSDLVKLVYR